MIREPGKLGMRGGDRGEGSGCEGSGCCKIAFWKVAGLRNKDEDFWKGLEEWDIMVLSETWVEEKDWGYVEKRLPRGYVWESQWAKTESKKGRAIRGMMMGVRKGLGMEEGVSREKEGLMVRKVRIGGEWWRIIGVYVNKDLQRKLEELKEWTEEREVGVRNVIGGDFNAGTGRMGGEVRDTEEEVGDNGESRESRDKVVNGGGGEIAM